ncbi:MAG: aldo/keto reductase [Candidatus Bathyarchaeota archaeon]|nr:aldo/keto reductase [Candidatus Bathyarchaeota archaeon]
MKYRILGNTGIELSAIGFGCMRLPPENSVAIPMMRRAVELGINYFETSITYCQNRSEIQLGLALKGMRDDVYVSTKSHIHREGERGFRGISERDSTGEDVKSNLEESLHKLGTDRVDFYQFHGFTLENLPVAMAEDGPLDALKAAKDKGLIGHIGFTSHDTPANIIKILDTGEFESMTVYYNLLQMERRGRGELEKLVSAIEHARKLGVGVIVMGPLGGGILGTPIEKLRDLIPSTSNQVELAFRYLLSIPGVTTPISGMTRMSDVEENARIASEYEPLSTDELARIEAIIGRYSSLLARFCTGCGYCQPCPSGVRIPEIFNLVNFYRVYEVGDWARQGYEQLQSSRFHGSADLCIECGACEEKCPQKISIRDELKKAHTLLTKAS